MKLFVTSSSSLPSEGLLKSAPPDMSTIAVYDTDPSLFKGSKRNDVPFVQLEEIKSVERNCSCLSSLTKELLIAQPEGVFAYSVAEQGSAIGIDGSKHFILSLGLYVMLISNEDGDAIIHVYDFKRRYISYSARLSEVTVVHAFHDVSPTKGHFVALYLSDGRVHRVIEMSPEAIVKYFCDLELFEVGLIISAENQYPWQLLCTIYKAHGDHLYKQNKVENALDKYICAIGSDLLSASYIIERYKSSSLSHLLVRYLFALTEAGLACREHISLLIHRLSDNPHLISDINRLVEWIKIRGISSNHCADLRKLVWSMAGDHRVEDAKRIAITCSLFEEVITLRIRETFIDCRSLAVDILTYSKFISAGRLQRILLDNAKTLESINAADLIALLVNLSTQKNDLTGVYTLTISQCMKILQECSTNTQKLYMLNLPDSFDYEIALPLLRVLLDERVSIALDNADVFAIENQILDLLQRPPFQNEELGISAVLLLRERSFNRGVAKLLQNVFPALKGLLLSAIAYSGDVHELVASVHDAYFNNNREYREVIKTLIELIPRNDIQREQFDMLREIVQILTSRGILDPSEVSKL